MSVTSFTGSTEVVQCYEADERRWSKAEVAVAVQREEEEGESGLGTWHFHVGMPGFSLGVFTHRRRKRRPIRPIVAQGLEGWGQLGPWRAGGWKWAGGRWRRWRGVPNGGECCFPGGALSQQRHGLAEGRRHVLLWASRNAREAG
jgi:hypothetical protein